MQSAEAFHKMADPMAALAAIENWVDDGPDRKPVAIADSEPRVEPVLQSADASDFLDEPVEIADGPFAAGVEAGETTMLECLSCGCVTTVQNRESPHVAHCDHCGALLDLV